MKLPAKNAAFGERETTSADEPQKGRYRYFHQWDIEVYGKPNLESNRNHRINISTFDSLLLKNITIDINHRNLVESFINKTFDSKEPPLVADILRAVDKISKKSKEEIIKEFESKGYDKSKLKKILDSLKSGTIKEVENSFDTSQ